MAHLSKGKRCYSAKSALYYFLYEHESTARFSYLLSIPLNQFERHSGALI